MSLIVKAPPVNTALTTDEAKLHLRLEADDSSMDAEIAGIIAAATAMLEADTGLALIQRTVTLFIDGFSKGVALPVWPVQSVSAVRFEDIEGAEVVVDAEDYDLSKSGKPKCLIFKDDILSLNVSETPGSIEIDIVIGFGAAATDVPADLKAALKLLLSHFDMNREAVSQGVRLKELPLGVDRLISPHRVHF